MNNKSLNSKQKPELEPILLPEYDDIESDLPPVLRAFMQAHLRMAKRRLLEENDQDKTKRNP